MLNKNQLEEITTDSPTVFILGAGLSTASGISDFKSLQKSFDTTELLSIQAYQHKYWQQHDFMAKYLMVNGKPNIAHQWLARLSQKDNIRLISQNIDSLLETAGAKKDHLIKIHGTLDRFLDVNHQTVDITSEEYKKLNPKTGNLNYVRPDIVFYGEQVKNFNEALDWVNHAKVIVVMGTRLNVFPVSQLALSGEQMQRLIIINTDPINIESSPSVEVNQINEPINTWLKN